MELTRLATRLLWHIVQRSKNGEYVTRTVLRWHAGSISTENVNLTLAHLIAAGLIVEGKGPRRPHRGAIPTFYAPTKKAMALELKRPRHGNFRTDCGNTSISARLSVELYNRLAAAADANDIPLNTEITRRLQASFIERVRSLDVGAGDVNIDFGGDGSPQA